MEASPNKYIYVSIITYGAKKKKMEKIKIVKSWELKATSQKSFYKKAYVLEDENANMGNQYYGIPFACRW